MITLQLSHMHGIASDMIAEFTHGWPSHVDTVMSDGRLLGARSDVWSPVPAGVQLRPDPYAPFSKTDRLVIPCTLAQEGDYYNFLMAQIGKPYDKEAIIGLVIGRNWRNPDMWFCSELVAAGLETAKIIRPIAHGIEFISPRDIWIIGSAIV